MKIPDATSSRILPSGLITKGVFCVLALPWPTRIVYVYKVLPPPATATVNTASPGTALLGMVALYTLFANVGRPVGAGCVVAPGRGVSTVVSRSGFRNVHERDWPIWSCPLPSRWG